MCDAIMWAKALFISTSNEIKSVLRVEISVSFVGMIMLSNILILDARTTYCVVQGAWKNFVLR